MEFSLACVTFLSKIGHQEIPEPHSIKYPNKTINKLVLVNGYMQDYGKSVAMALRVASLALSYQCTFPCHTVLYMI